MRKFLLSLFAFVASATMSFAQTNVTKLCSDYNCNLFLSFSPITDADESMPNVKVTLSEGSEAGTVNFSLKDFYLDEDTPLGDIVLENIGVNERDADGKYTFKENTPVRLSLLGDAINADVNLNAETSYVQDGILYADVDILWVDENSPIYVRVVSSNPTETKVSSVVAGQTKVNGVYSISGVRVSKPSAKGVYIVNGKKIIK